VSSLGQCTDRQLDGVPLDQTFTDRCSGKDTNRPALIALLNHVRAGETMVCHSLDRLARNLTDLRALVTDLTDRGVRVEFAKENLAFTGGDSPLQTLLLSMLGSVAEFERALIKERQLEGVALAKAAGRYKGGTAKLSREQATELRERAAGPCRGRAPTRTRPPSNRGQAGAGAERWRGSIFEGAWGWLRTGRTQPPRVLGIAPPTRRGDGRR